ncbi:MAG: acylphosphatase [Bacteroidia bacterium]|jgi:acylphosphatase|nr:acylphosphatase [Bacteroidia bacterium]
MKRFSLTISGKVQGVFYRKSAAAEAQRIGLTGFVKNLPDGSVYAQAQGTDEQLEEFVNWCKRGPDRARVEKVDVLEIELITDEKIFGIRY